MKKDSDLVSVRATAIVYDPDRDEAPGPKSATVEASRDMLEIFGGDAEEAEEYVCELVEAKTGVPVAGCGFEAKI